MMTIAAFNIYPVVLLLISVVVSAGNINASLALHQSTFLQKQRMFGSAHVNWVFVDSSLCNIKSVKESSKVEKKCNKLGCPGG